MATIATGVQNLLRGDPVLPPIPASLFYRKDGYSVGNIPIDLVLTEEHALISDVSVHPTEVGSDVTDNIRKRLRAGSLTALVSNYSLRTTFDNTQVPTERLIEESYLAVQQSNRAMLTWEAFKQLWDRGELVDIVTTLEVYKNVAITNVSASRDSDSGEAQVFSVSFQEVKQVTLQQVTVSATVQPEDMTSELNRLASTKSNNGVKVGTPTITMSENLGV